MRTLLRLAIVSCLFCLPGCGALTGAALGGILCSAGDTACRSRLVESGARADLGFVTVGGERYATSMVYDCHTPSGRTLVIHGDNNPGWTCMQATGEWTCFCVGWSRH
jgi:hypothetical protein